MKHNWTYKKLGELVNIRTGKLDANAANEGGQYPFFTCSREPLRINTFSYDCECVLVAGNGELNVKYYNGKFDAYQRTYIIEKKPEVDYISTYYIYLFFQKYIDVLRSGSIGGIIKYIKLGDLTNAVIPIPAKDEQQAIVRELDGINRLIDLQEEQLREYDRLAQSLFYTTFGDPATNPKGWEVKKLGEVCDVRDGTHDSPQYLQHSDYLLITSKNIVDGRIDFSTATNYISKEDYDAINKRSKVDVGDIIMPMIGTIGHPIIVREAEQRYCIKNVALIKFCGNSDVVNAYVKMLIDSPSYMQYMLGLNKGGTQKFIALGTIRQLSLPLPPLSLQQNFAAQIEAIEQQKALIRKSLDETRTLLAARMQYYFE